MHRACMLGDLEKVKWLIDVCELSPASKDNKGTSPFHTAIVNGNHEIVEFLVEYDGSLISCLDENTGWYPLHWAVFLNNSECTLVLLKHGADMLQPSDDGADVLQPSDDGADVLQPSDEQKVTALHIAIQEESMKCKYLFSNS